MSGLALPEAVAGAHVDAQQDATTGPFLSHTALDGTHSNSPNNGSEMDKRLKPGLLVAVSVDPIATLRPLFEGDDAIEKAAWEMFPRMRRYIAFLRDVESLQKCVADHGDELEGDPIIETEDMPLLAGTGVHLNLMHTQRPSRSRYDTIDESMSVPLYVERPSSPTAPASLPQRQNSRRYPGLVRTSARKPIVAQSTNGSLPWKELYAHTIMDAFAAVSDVDAASPRNGDLSSFELSMKDMQRYDGYQAVDRARESNQSQKVHANGGDPVDIVDDWDMEEDEEEDESQFRLSTVISGLTMEEDYSVPDQARDASMSFALPGRHPSSRVASPVSSGVAPSAWKGKQIRLHQPQRPQLDYITATDAQVPQFQEPLSPKSPTMTGASGETSDSKHTNLSSASTPTSISPSTQATSVPDHLISSIPAPLECQVEEARNDNEAAPWDFTRLDLGGGLGSNKPLDRRCAIHVRIWLDLGNEDMREPEDPRTFFEELKMLRALERTSDIRYVAQQKQANAQRVLAWRSSTTPKAIKSPSKSTLSLNNPFSSSHVKHLSGSTYHNPFKIARRRTSMPVTSTKSRKPSFLLTTPLHAPAFLLDRRRSSGALQGAKVLATEQTSSTISSFKKVWNRLVCRPPR